MATKILIVEDNEVIYQQLHYFLQRYDYIVVNCITGEDALEKINDFKPEIILMDIQLAGQLDGIETAARIKRIYKCPIIFLTSHIENSIIERAILAEPDGFISKNISHSELKVQIDYNLRKFKKQKELSEKIQYLENNNQIYELIFNNAKDAIFYLTEDFRVNYLNPTAESLFGFDKSFIMNKNLFDFIIDHKDKASFFEELVKLVNIDDERLFYKKFTLVLIKRNGDTFNGELSIGKIKFGQSFSYCTFIRDISEQVTAEEEVKKLIEEMQITREIIEQNASELVQLNAKLSASEEMLRELNASKDKFFSIIAHDLKGPFQNLIGYSKLLVEDFENLSTEDIRELSINLHNSANNLYRLLENLLQWSRLQRGVIEYNPIEFELSLLAVQNFELIQNRATEKGIELINKVSDDILIFADVNMINTVLRNLLSNALKFTHSGGKIELKAKKLSPDKVQIEVIDRGIGMSEEFAKNVFKIDSYKSTPGTDNEQGTGLGLILCKDLIEKNKGSISVESKLGEGTKFTIILPSAHKD